LLDLEIIKEVRSNIAIQTLKVGAPLPLQHLEPRRLTPPGRRA
jgi:Lrp/AsnC family leucine-responsive transcriptional regulator